MPVIPTQLLNIEERRRALLDRLSEGVDVGNEEELTVLAGLFEEANEDRAEQLQEWTDDMVKIVHVLKAEIAATDAFKDTITALASRKKAALDQVRDNVATTFALLGVQKVKTATGTAFISTRHRNVVVNPLGQEINQLLAPEFVRTTYAADMAAINAAIKSGETVTHVDTEEYQSVTIR
jgi:hypothetical protein